jgi:MotA/TolQ/ExbB proton channel family
MSPSASLSDFLGAYRLHLSGYDWFILTLGALLLLTQTALSLWARAVLVRPPGALPFLRQLSLKLFDRLCASVIEVFTLLGLLGTVFSLLYTFTRADTKDPNDVLRAFAPAFTATISGLLCAISNKLLYDTAFSPLLEELLALFPSQTPAPSATTTATAPQATQPSLRTTPDATRAHENGLTTSAPAPRTSEETPATTPEATPNSQQNPAPETAPAPSDQKISTTTPEATPNSQQNPTEPR